MTCLKCQHGTAVKAGSTNANTPRFRCNDCGARFTLPKPVGPLGTHTTSLDDAERVLTLLTEGMSIRAIARVTGVHKTTILSLLLTLGAKCATLFDERVTGLTPRFVQADELWTFVQKKQRRLKATDPAERGDQYIWIAMDSESKAVISYYVGKRDAIGAHTLMADVRRRIVNRCQITTDGLDSYPDAVEAAFGSQVDYGVCIKNYAAPNTNGPGKLVAYGLIVTACPRFQQAPFSSFTNLQNRQAVPSSLSDAEPQFCDRLSGGRVKGNTMANVGDRCKVGSNAPETGRYKHSACSNTAIFNKGNNLTPCQNVSCPDRGADWILQEKLT